MNHALNSFIQDEDGAITVDWVVLTAFIVTLMGLGYGALETATTTSSANTATYITNQAPN